MANYAAYTSGDKLTAALLNTRLVKWAKINTNGVANDSFGVASVVDEGLGDFTITWSTAFDNVNYSAGGSAQQDSLGTQVTNFVVQVQNTGKLTGSTRFEVIRKIMVPFKTQLQL